MELAIQRLKEGVPVIIMDDENRENEGDLCLPAQFMTEEMLLFFQHQGTGMICVSCSAQRVDQLGLSKICEESTDPNGTPFRIPVDLDPRHGNDKSGVSIADRTRTINALANPKYQRSDFTYPGHVQVLRANPKGLGLGGRKGHTEASVELCLLAGIFPACAIVELMDQTTGKMMRYPQCEKFAQEHGFSIITIADILKYIIPGVKLPIQLNDHRVDVEMRIFTLDDNEYVVVTKGEVKGKSEIFLRIHSECFTGDILGSMKCDCGDQWKFALQELDHRDTGILIYIRGHEGRGIGLQRKIQCYQLQEHGYDTIEANLKLHLPVDCRDFHPINEILDQLGVNTVNLYTNNPNKSSALRDRIGKITSFTGSKNSLNKFYLETKEKYHRHMKKIGIAHTTTWHSKYVNKLVSTCEEELQKHPDIEIVKYGVSGSYELPSGARYLFNQGCSVVITIGILLNGETHHFESVLRSVELGLRLVESEYKKPILYGVLACDRKKHIRERTFGKLNTAADWAKQAVEFTKVF